MYVNMVKKNISKEMNSKCLVSTSLFTAFLQLVCKKNILNSTKKRQSVIIKILST